jgi:hypothetical protein
VPPLRVEYPGLICDGLGSAPKARSSIQENVIAQWVERHGIELTCRWEGGSQCDCGCRYSGNAERQGRWRRRSARVGVSEQGLHAVEADGCDDYQREDPPWRASAWPGHVINDATWIWWCHDDDSYLRWPPTLTVAVTVPVTHPPWLWFRAPVLPTRETSSDAHYDSCDREKTRSDNSIVEDGCVALESRK